MDFPPIICPCCGKPVMSVPSGQYSCTTCPGAIRMVDGIPVFAVRSNHLAEVTAGILASHRYNAETPADAHLAYTTHTLATYRTLRKIIDGSHPESKKRRLTILDVGGGRGELALLFAGRYDTAMIDVDLYSAQAAQVLQVGASHFRVLCGD